MVTTVLSKVQHTTSSTNSIYGESYFGQTVPIMLDAFSCLLCSKLCWYNRLVPTKGKPEERIPFTNRIYILANIYHRF